MAVRRPYNPGKPDMFGKTVAQYQVEYANKELKARRGLSSAEQMKWLQEQSRGNPAPRGGVTGRLEGNIAQGTGGNSYSPFKTPPMSRGTKGGPVKPPKKVKPATPAKRVAKFGSGGGLRIGLRRGIGER